MRVLTLAGESSHFGGWDFSPCCTESESSHSGRWEFTLWRVRLLTVLGESSPHSRWDFTMWWVKVIIRGWALGESSYRWVRVFTALGEDFPSGEWKVLFVGESLTVVGGSCHSSVKLLALGRRFPLQLCGSVHYSSVCYCILCVTSGTIHCNEWDLLPRVTFYCNGWDLHCTSKGELAREVCKLRVFTSRLAYESLYFWHVEHL